MSTTTVPATTCPDLEDLAAFVDGQLSGAERDAMVEHLGTCEDCYEVYAETLRIQEDVGLLGEEAEEEAEAELAPVVVHPRSFGWAWKTGLVAAAAAVAAVLGLSWLERTATMPSAEELVVALGVSSDTRLEESWQEHGWPRTRGGALDSPPPWSENERERRIVSFRAGVSVVDLRLALVTGDRKTAKEATREVWRQLNDLELAPFSTPMYEVLQQQLDVDPLPRLFEKASKAEEQLAQDPFVDPLFVDFGKWTATARIAALQDDARYFERREFNRFLARLQREDLSPQLSEQLQAVRTLAREGPSEELRKALEAIIDGQGVSVR